MSLELDISADRHRTLSNAFFKIGAYRVERRVEHPPIYTIGYGNRALADFLALLQRYEIRYLVDIRSQPYSRFHPDYSKAALEGAIKQQGLRYVFMGEALGGRPQDTTCYVNGKAFLSTGYSTSAYRLGKADKHGPDVQ